MTTSVVIKPSGRGILKGKPWTLVVRTHDLSGTDYATICDLSEEQADAIVSEGQITYLYGNGENELAALARAKARAIATAEGLRKAAEAHEKDCGLTVEERRMSTVKMAERAGVVVDFYRSITNQDEDDAISDLLNDLLHLVRARKSDPARLLANVFSNFRSEEFDHEAGPAVQIVDNGSVIAETYGYRSDEVPDYVGVPAAKDPLSSEAE